MSASTFRLGHLPSQDDDRTLNFARYTTAELAPPPKAVDWTGKASRWRTLGNDRMGNCEVVTTANLVQLWTSMLDAEVLIPEADVVRAYSAITGYNPQTGRPDPGIRTLDMLNYWRKRGVGGRGMLAFVRLDHTNREQVRTAAALFGGVFTAFQLPLTAQDQFDRRQVWRSSTTTRRGRRGSWGGHAVALAGYDATGATCITWGRPQRMTWGFVDAYLSEAWAVISPDQVGAAGRTPLGFDMDKLRADLSAITSVRDADA